VSASTAHSILDLALRVRREAGRQSLLAFCKLYLGDRFTLPWNTMHREAAALLVSERGGPLRLALAAPDGYGKSSLLTFAFPIWALAYGRARFIVIASHAKVAAGELLRAIDLELRGNELLRQDFGHLKTISRSSGASRSRASTARDMHVRLADNHEAVTGFGMSFVVHERDGRRVYENAGSGPGFQATMVLIPDQQVGLVVMIAGGVGDFGPLESLRRGGGDDTAQPRAHTLNMFEVRAAFLDQLLGPFELAKPSAVRIDIYDVTGRRVRQLENTHFEAGTFERIWLGSDDSGRSLSSGVYYVRMTTESRVDTRKVMLLK